MRADSTCFGVFRQGANGRRLLSAAIRRKILHQGVHYIEQGITINPRALKRRTQRLIAELRLKLRVYNYAQVETKELARAEEKASEVLGIAGVKAIWLDCVAPGINARNGDACAGTGGAGGLVLNILTRAMAERSEFGSDTLGFATVSDNDKPAIVASVFYHRVESLAAEVRCARDLLLGYSLAHEIGHLLLRTNSHAPMGIMRAHWTGEELSLASKGWLGFSSQQSAQMRADVQKRNAIAASAA